MKCIYWEGMSILEICVPLVSTENPKLGLQLSVYRFRFYSGSCPQKISTSSLKLFVMDEADELLGMGFKDQIYDIFKLMPPEVQVALFSATMAPEVLDITTKFMRDPLRILLRTQLTTAPNFFF